MSGDVHTIADVAARVQVHRKTVERAIARGELEASQLGAGAAYRITEDAVQRWLESRRVTPRSAGTDVHLPARARGGRRRGRLVLHEGMGRRSA